MQNVLDSDLPFVAGSSGPTSTNRLPTLKVDSGTCS